MTAALRVANSLLSQQHCRNLLPFVLDGTGVSLEDAAPTRGKYNMTCQPNVPLLVVRSLARAAVKYRSRSAGKLPF